MGKLRLIIESATLPSGLETVNVLVELVLPVVGLLNGQVGIAPLLGEHAEFVQSLERVTGWDLLVFFLSRSGNGEKGKSLHSFLVMLFLFGQVPYRSSDPH